MQFSAMNTADHMREISGGPGIHPKARNPRQDNLCRCTRFERGPSSRPLDCICGSGTSAVCPVHAVKFPVVIVEDEAVPPGSAFALWEGRAELVPLWPG